MEWALLFTWLPSLFLHFVRVGAFFVGQPLFGMQGESKMLRLVLAVSLGAIFFWVDGKPIVVTGGLPEFAMLATREAAIGLVLGLGVRMITMALAIAGEVLSHEMGFAMAQVVNPATGRNSAVFSQFLEVMAFVLIFELDLHHDIIQAFRAVYEIVPVGDGFSVDVVFHHLTAMIGDGITYAIRYALPVMGVMVLLTAVLVMLSRAVQNINLLEFSFGLRILLSLLSAVFFLIEGAPFLERMFEDFIERIATLFVEI